MMTGASADHLVSVTTLVAALLVCMAIYNQTIGNATAYQQNHQIAMKANSLIDSMCLSAGFPEYFGLQDPDTRGYSLRPFALQRLLASGELLYYDRMDAWFSNFTAHSLGEGDHLLVPVSDCVDYSTATRLLSVNGSYGFQLSIAPILRVFITETDANPLTLKVEVRGPGLAFNGATLKYHLFRAYVQDEESFPLIDSRSGVAKTDNKGSAVLDFDPPINNPKAYVIIVYASLRGLVGVGFHSYVTVAKWEGIIPVIENIEEGELVLAHAWDVNYQNPPVPNFFYNATFLLLTENFELLRMQIPNSTGQLNYGEKNYAKTKLPSSEAGIVLLMYRRGNQFGISMIPWGIYPLGASVIFGGDPSGRDWVATELRHVAVRQISYQVKLAVWREGG